MWITIKSDFFSSPFDCVVLSATLVAITDIWYPWKGIENAYYKHRKATGGS